MHPPTFSFEIFPAKTEESQKKLYRELEKMALLSPEFISVTCGAGGTDNRNNIRVCDYINNTLQVPCMSHICCIGETHETIESKFAAYNDIDIRSFLALRGDFPSELERERSKHSEFRYAADLVAYMLENHPENNISVAGYPEGHNQNPSKEDDFERQLAKAKLGAQKVFTQLFLDNRLFFDYYEAMRDSGYKGQIIPGIFPITNTKQIIKIANLCGSYIPKSVLDACEKYQDDSTGMEQWGIEYAIGQIEELRQFNHQHIHLYSMNQSKHIMKIQNYFRPPLRSPQTTDELCLNTNI